MKKQTCLNGILKVFEADQQNLIECGCTKTV